MSVRIRAARAADGDAIIAIELAAGERFREVGMSEIADDDPGSVDELAEYADDGRSWVAVDDTGTPVGYVLVDLVDGNAHIEQVSVVPSAQGTGIGRALIEHVAGWARARDAVALTLTTFRDVPWNAPLYEHLGFRVLAEPELGPELRALRATEAAHGLDPAIRACMLRALHASDGGDAHRRSTCDAASMEISCAGCGCIVDRGVVTSPCDRHPTCCCADLPQRPEEAEPPDA